MCFFFAMNMMVASNALLEHSTLYPFANNKMMLDTIVSTPSMTTITCAKPTQQISSVEESLIEMLPNEMRSEIFSKLIEANDWKTLCRASEVSWAWKCEIDRLWRNYCVQNKMTSDEDIWTKKGKNWKWVCACLSNIFDKDDTNKNGTGVCQKSSVGPVEIRFEGEWKENKKNGVGRIWWSNGDRYLGDWSNDSKDGYGYMMWENGDMYEGGWKSDLRDGTNCKYLYSNGGIYQGGYCNDERHSDGAFIWPDGERFVGKWKAGGRFGKGILYTKNGAVEQEWEESPFVNYSDSLPSKYPPSKNAGSSS